MNISLDIRPQEENARFGPRENTYVNKNTWQYTKIFP